MMDQELLYMEIQTALSMLDEGELLETQEYLAGLLGEEETVRESPYEIVCNLMRCDRMAPLPDFMVDFATELYEVEMEEGNADAMNDLGSHYYTGNRGFPQDFGRAVKYYHLAARHGSRQAQENLGYCYYYGRAVPIDYKKAFHYFALGAFDGHLISLYKIGDMYLNGYYVEKNEKEAFHIYTHCAETMTKQAEPYVAGPVFLRLGKMFLYGLGTKQDLHSALVCYQKAEVFLYDMVKNGAVMYKKSLQEAVEGQRYTREKLTEELPSEEWNYD